MEKTVKFEPVTFGKRMKSMLKVDFRRMFKSRLFYILLATALLVPVVMTVMLTMMDGQESVNQQTGEVTVMEGPDSVWQSIGTLPTTDNNTEGGEAATMGDMDVMAMCKTISLVERSVRRNKTCYKRIRQNGRQLKK